MGDRVATRARSTLLVAIERHERAVRVFDLTVERDETFFAEGILVHNKSSNEGGAIGSLKTIATAEEIYREGKSEEDHLYASLAEVSSSRLVDSILGSGTKYGYVFAVEPSSVAPGASWIATATPRIPGRTGERYFIANQGGVIFYTTGSPFLLDRRTCAIPREALPLWK